MTRKPWTLACIALLVAATAQPAVVIGAAPPLQAEARDQPVTREDLRILQRALELLQEPGGWSRKDERECADDEAQNRRSLFCALQRASIDVLGAYEHRRVALQEVRFAVEEATRGRAFEHRLRDFNNLPETSLADVRAVLNAASDRVTARLRQQK